MFTPWLSYLGIGYFFHILSMADNTYFDQKQRQQAAETAQKIARRCLRHVDLSRLYKNVSVFTGAVGPLCLATLSYRSESEPGTARAAESSADECLKRILQAHEFVIPADSGMPDEALYGRTGYLNALIVLHTAGISVPTDIVSSVRLLSGFIIYIFTKWICYLVLR